MDLRETAILDDLAIVDRLRAMRGAEEPFGRRVTALKRYQQRRFEHTYADLLQSPRYSRAAQFFLDELYGPADFSHRDAQFARVVPALVRLFPSDVIDTVATLARLHALSEDLDTEMARHLDGDVTIDASAYARAWGLTGRAADRQRQIDLTLEVGRCLDRFTRNPLLRHSLRLMRGPAKAAGLAQLQCFLESGFDTFAAMKGAAHFLSTVREREEALARALFGACSSGAGDAGALGGPRVHHIPEELLP